MDISNEEVSSYDIGLRVDPFVEHLAYPYSEEAFELMKESLEIEILEKYLDNMSYYSDHKQDFYEGTSVYGLDYFQEFEISYVEAASTLNKKRKGFLSRILDSIRKLFRRFSSVSQSLASKNLEFFQKSEKFDIHRMDESWFSHVWTKKEISKFFKENKIDVNKYAKMNILLNKGQSSPDLKFDKSVDEKTRRGFTNFTILGFRYGCQIDLKSVADQERKDRSKGLNYQVPGGSNAVINMANTLGAVGSLCAAAFCISKLNGIVMTTTKFGNTVSNVLEDIKNGNCGKAIETVNNLRAERDKEAARYDPKNPKQAAIIRATCDKLDKQIQSILDDVREQTGLEMNSINTGFEKQDAKHSADQSKKAIVKNATTGLGNTLTAAGRMIRGDATVLDVQAAGKNLASDIRAGVNSAKAANEQLKAASSKDLEAKNAEAQHSDVLGEGIKAARVLSGVTAAMTGTNLTAEQNISDACMQAVQVVTNVSRNGVGALLDTSSDTKALPAGQVVPAIDSPDVMSEEIDTSEEKPSSTKGTTYNPEKGKSKQPTKPKGKRRTRGEALADNFQRGIKKVGDGAKKKFDNSVVGRTLSDLKG